MRNELLNNFKQKLDSNNGVFGPFMKSGDPAFIEASGYAGFDFVILDMEHGPNSLETMQNLVRAAIVSGVFPVIRTRDRLPESISQALDIGALGVQVPQLTTAEEVRMAVKAAKFSPLGERGVCRFVRAADYSALPGAEYLKAANENLLIIQLEGKKALENLDEILTVSGVDIFFVGPYDLSQSLGVPGQIKDPLVIHAIKAIVQKAGEKSCVVGLFTDTIEDAVYWKNLGVSYISFSVDVGIYYSACKGLVSKFRQE